MVHRCPADMFLGVKCYNCPHNIMLRLHMYIISSTDSQKGSSLIERLIQIRAGQLRQSVKAYIF